MLISNPFQYKFIFAVLRPLPADVRRMICKLLLIPSISNLMYDKKPDTDDLPYLSNCDWLLKCDLMSGSEFAARVALLMTSDGTIKKLNFHLWMIIDYWKLELKIKHICMLVGREFTEPHYNTPKILQRTKSFRVYSVLYTTIVANKLFSFEETLLLFCTTYNILMSALSNDFYKSGSTPTHPISDVDTMVGDIDDNADSTTPIIRDYE
jgi:hypothetical protein